MKKKLIAIVLSVLLVVSAVLVLAACKKTEYVVTFRNYDALKVFELETVDGKLTKEMVDNAMQQTPPKHQGEGWTFKGWYDSLTADKDGNLVYGNEINYSKTYTENASYYADWNFTPQEGSKNGYTIIGVINGVTNWSPGTEPEAWMLKQDATKKYIYSLTFDVKGNDQIKVKEKVDIEWNPPACNTNLGYDGVGTVSLGKDVTLPEGISAHVQDGNDGEKAVIYGKGNGNVFVSSHVTAMNITLTFDYQQGKFDIVINSVTWKNVIKPIKYILVGKLKEAEWDADWSADDHADIEALVFGEVGKANEYTLTYTFRANDQFKVTVNNNTWNPEWGWSTGDDAKLSITAESGVDATGVFDNDGTNIHVVKACTVKITIKVTEGTIELHITSLGA